MGELNPDAALDDGQQTDNCINEGEESSSNVQYPVISDADNLVRSAGPYNGRKPGPDSKAAKISAFNNNPTPPDDLYQKKSQPVGVTPGGNSIGGLVVSGIPMSQRAGAPIPNLQGVNAQYRNVKPTVTEDQPAADRISRTKTAKENKAIKEKMDAEYKQSIEGLSIVGTSANNKK